MCDFGESKDALQYKEENISSSSDVKVTKNNFSNKPKSSNFFKTRTCSYFYNNGYCKFGNSCRYKHYKKRNNNDKYGAKESSSSFSKNILEKVNEGKKGSQQSTDAQTSSKQETEEKFRADNCELQHSVDLCSNKLSDLNFSPSLQRMPVNFNSASQRSSKMQNKPLCYYFKKGLCYKGDSCRYYHHKRSVTNLTKEKVPALFIENKDSPLPSHNKVENANFMTQNSISNKPTIFKRALHIHDLSSLTIESITQLRSTEISQLKKRFPHFENVVENQTFSVTFEPSDPDWAFDVKSLKLEVNFPEKYPTEKCKITVIQSAENIPSLLIKYLNKAIYEWVDKKFEEDNASNKTELIFRMFLKWFDKNLEDLFISGLKKVKQDLKAKEDGIEFVPVENLFSSSKDCNSEEVIDKIDVIQNTSQPQAQTAVSDVTNSQPVTNKNDKPHHYDGNNGMKIILSGLELTEGAAAFICTKISITLLCCRCKTPFNMKSVPKKNNSYMCLKCSKNVGFTFDPSTVHQFSSVLGTLHLLDCTAVDINLVECHFLVDCLKCSKQVSVDGVHYGQKHKMWCIFCNEKMLISIQCVKFQTLKLASVLDGKYIPAKKVEKKAKDPVIKEGEPLPGFGTCKHYKKSFRWLRFPCCGRLYPCDECHNEKETDHEMKYASRMLCGFCSKEQPYSQENPCISCSQSMTKKSSSHWEGGKGCRNKIQMSREDKHKYAGVSKTISKKAQSVKSKKK